MLTISTYTVAVLLTTLTLVLPQSAQAVTLSGMQAQFSMTRNAEGDRVVNLLFNSTLFGDGGLASGFLSNTVPPDPIFPPEPVFPPEPILWTIDPFGGATPDDGSVGLSFIINAQGEVSGVEPTPFRMFVSDANGRPLSAFGNYLELDFDGVGGMLGSLVLTGLMLYEVDGNGVRTGSVYGLDQFSIQPVPIPAGVWLLLSALGVLGFAGMRRKLVAAP